MTTTQPVRSETSSKYMGGNEVFFSFLGAVLDGVDAKLLDEDAFHEVVRRWGAELAKRASLGGDLKALLGGFGRVLSTLGLARTFEQLPGNEATPRMLALKVLDERYVGAPRRAAQRSYRSLIALLLEGCLNAADLSYHVSESREGMLHDDELLLTLTPRS
jgi:hypothetical protein